MTFFFFFIFFVFYIPEPLHHSLRGKRLPSKRGITLVLCIAGDVRHRQLGQRRKTPSKLLQISISERSDGTRLTTLYTWEFSLQGQNS